MTRARSLAVLGSLCLALGCAGVKPNATGPGTGASTGNGGSGNTTGTGTGGTNPPPSTCNGSCADFSSTPVVDGSANNCLLIATTKDGTILEKIEGLNNATAVTVDSKGDIYVGEVNGMNVKKFVRQ